MPASQTAALRKKRKNQISGISEFMALKKTTKENTKNIKELIELNDELENYFRNTIIPQLFVDADLILRKFTPPAMKQFDFSPDHIGKPMAELADNIRFSTILDDISEVIESKEILEKEIQTSDLRWFQMNIIPYVIVKENKLNGVIITFIDITDRIKNLRELEKLNASHETFIYSVSHDLKAPLANIEALATNLVETSAELLGHKQNKEQKKIAELLENSVKMMRVIINELSDIARIDGNYHEAVETILFENILKEVEMTVKDKVRESDTSITYDLKKKKIDFSRKNLRSILYNLLSNAIKYKSPDRPSLIEIKTRKKNGFVQISVKDNGLGVPEEKQKIIFSQFTRISKDVEGTGIGLYLVKRIVENAGGKIEIKSTVGKGSKFTVHLKPAEKTKKETTEESTSDFSQL